MIFSKKFFLLILIFIFFTTYNPQSNRRNISYFFPIKNIIIENTKTINTDQIVIGLEFLRNESLLFLNKQKIEYTLLENEIISKVFLKKKYPNTLRVIIFEKIPVAIQISGKNKFYITKKNESIDYIELDIYAELPVIFGDQKNFNLFYEELEKNNFDIKNIKAFYYFDVGRWDIMLNDERIIKLPEKNFQSLLAKVGLLLEDSNFSKYKIFDYRVNNQLILK